MFKALYKKGLHECEIYTVWISKISDKEKLVPKHYWIEKGWIVLTEVKFTIILY